MPAIVIAGDEAARGERLFLLLEDVVLGIVGVDPALVFSHA